MHIISSFIEFIQSFFHPKPTPTPIPSPTPIPPISSDVDKIIVLVNNERVKRNLKPLVKNDKLMIAATNYANLMATKNTLSHNINGGLSSRIDKVQYEWSNIGENIAWNNDVSGTVQDWMNSSGHRSNILGNYIDTGVGICDKGNGPYYCQDFGK